MSALAFSTASRWARASSVAEKRLGRQPVAGFGEGEVGQFGHELILVIPAGRAPVRDAGGRFVDSAALAGPIRYSTTFGTRKKLSSVAGALRDDLLRIAAVGDAVLALLHRPSGVTEVIGSTPSTSTSFSCSTKDEDGVELALQMRHVLVRRRRCARAARCAGPCSDRPTWIANPSFESWPAAYSTRPPPAATLRCARPTVLCGTTTWMPVPSRAATNRSAFGSMIGKEP